MLACAWLAVTHAPVTTDLDAFLPAGDDSADLISALSAGPAQRLILMGITGGRLEARAEVSVALADALRTTKLFRQVVNGQNTMGAREQQLLFSHRYLLSPQIDAQSFSVEALREALHERLQELRSPVPITDTRTLTADPTREAYAVFSAWRGVRRPAMRSGVWFSRDGKYAVLLAQTRAAGFDLDAQTRVVARIRATFETVSRSHPGTRLVMSGPPVFATTAQNNIRSTVARISIVTSLATALILLFAYRSWRILVLAALPLASAILTAVAATGLVFGELYGITLAFGMTLLGVAMDYPVHLFSHRSRAESVAATMRRIWPILRLGVISTALGYFAMVTADLVGLRQLGVFAIVGLLTAAAVTRWVVPAFLPAAWTPTRAGLGRWMDVLLRPRWWTAPVLVALCMALLVATVIASPRLWEDDLSSLSPIPADALAVDRALRRALGATEADHMALIEAPTPQIALERSEILAIELQKAIHQGLISGFDMASRYLPSLRAQDVRRALLPRRAELEANLQQALAGLPFKPDAFKPFVDDVQMAREGEPLYPGDLRGSTLGAQVHSLLFKYKEGWLALVPLAGVDDPRALATWFAAEAPDARYLDLTTATQSLMAHFRDTGLARAAWGGLLITALLAAGLRSWRLVLASVIPVALAVAVTICALLALEDGGLSLFHIVSLLLVVGICIDYSLFFSHAGRDVAAHRGTLHAALVCAVSTIVVFAMLAGSPVPVLRAIGATVAVGVCVSFVLTLGLAPQLTRIGASTNSDSALPHD